MSQVQIAQGTPSFENCQAESATAQVVGETRCKSTSNWKPVFGDKITWIKYREGFGGSEGVNAFTETLFGDEFTSSFFLGRVSGALTGLTS